MHNDPSTPATPLQTAQTEDGRPIKRITRRLRKRPISTPTAIDPDTGSRLRLVGVGAPDMKPPTPNPTAIRGATDPRWVLAVRTAELLEGDVLPPNKRESLMRTGKVMGLSPFDCSLILAIVQDRARRGIAPERCPSASESQLALIPLPTQRSVWSAFTDKPGQAVLLAAGLIAFQVLLLWVWLS